MKELPELGQEATAGDPITGIKWPRKTLHALEPAGRHQGVQGSFVTIRRLLGHWGYASRVNRKRLTKEPPPDRDRQRRSVTRWRRAFLPVGTPVISGETKKRELVGNCRNAGATWRKEALSVLEYDYPRYADGVAIPVGIYAVGPKAGFLGVGISHQTPEVACAASRRGWWKVGQHP